MKITLMMRILILIQFLMILLNSLQNQMTLYHVSVPWMEIVILLMKLLILPISNKNKENVFMLYALSTFSKIQRMKESFSLFLLGNSTICHHVAQILESINLTLFQKKLETNTQIKFMSMKISSKQVNHLRLGWMRLIQLVSLTLQLMTLELKGIQTHLQTKLLYVSNFLSTHLMTTL